MVIYFSGNGNSKTIAVSLAQKLDSEIITLERDLLLNPAEHTITLPREDNMTVWVTPVYSWGVPPVVANVIKKINMPGAEHSKHFLVVTCGDDAGLIDRQWSKLLKQRNWTALGAYSVIMPNTYVCMKGFELDAPEEAARKIAESKPRTEEIYHKILRQMYRDTTTMETDLTRGKWAWIKSRIIYPWFIRHAMSPKPFRTDEQCTSCGLCERQCPMLNIRLTDGHPIWSDHCALCLRCLHHCPTHAIHYGNRQ